MQLMRVQRGRKFVLRQNFPAATKGQRECNTNNGNLSVSAMTILKLPTNCTNYFSQ